jgi:hypothetical protein
MKASIGGVLLVGVIIGTGCVSGGRYIKTRGVLDENIYYIEQDTSTALYTISSDTYGPGKEQAKRVPQPALVDMNSIIQVRIAKDRLKPGAPEGQLGKRAEELLNRKQTMTEALKLLDKVVQARTLALETYYQKNLQLFYQAKKDAATLERAMLAELMSLWSNDSKEYTLLEEAYDRPSFARLQEFLVTQIAAIKEDNRTIEDELKTRGRVFSLEAFLNSPEKEPVAVHLDGYDLIKEESTARRDRFGLNLSKEERDKLDAQIKATQEMAAALERLRSGEATLGLTLQELRSKMAPHLSSMINEAERLQRRLNPTKLAERKDETGKLYEAFFGMIEKANKELYESKKQKFKDDRTRLLSDLSIETAPFLTAMQAWEAAAKSLRQDWESATPLAVSGLIEKSIKAAKMFTALREKLPQIEQEVTAKAPEIVKRTINDIAEAEKEVFLRSPEAQALRSNLEEYYVDFRDTADLIAKAAASLSRLELQPIAEMPPITVSFAVPVENIKDTFLNLETTPRLPGDVVTVKATLKEGDVTVDTSNARFQIERFGHYAALSPAVVLVKPERLKSGDDGFRFAPVLSWTHHWYPRPEDTRGRASISRALDPAIGVHSAFTNFRSSAADETVQIGLGVTVSLWKNRLQFGAGYNLMADSKDDGRIYYFIGSDLIGLLQTIGIAKQ